MRAFFRTLQFIGFVLLEYLRSGRILVELSATIISFYLFLRSGTAIDATYFFTVAVVFSSLLALYSVSSMIGLGDRPQSYLLLSRQLTRGNFICGIYGAGLAVVFGAFGLLSLATALLNPALDLDLLGWLMGSLPMALNVGLIGALTLLLSGLILPVGWRLGVLGLFAIALSSNFLGGPFTTSLPAWGQAGLQAVQAIFGGPLVPILYGYQISISRDFADGTVWPNLLAQSSLLASFLILSVYAFARRDLIFTQ